MIKAAKQRTINLVTQAAKHVAEQLSSAQREQSFQRALAVELAEHLPTHTEYPCPVIYTTISGTTHTVATERIDILVTSKQRNWAAIIEVKKSNAPKQAATQAKRYAQNFKSTHNIPVATALAVCFYNESFTVIDAL